MISATGQSGLSGHCFSLTCFCWVLVVSVVLGQTEGRPGQKRLSTGLLFGLLGQFGILGMFTTDHLRIRQAEGPGTLLLL